jgi:ABC-type phosphate transport system substrate-binding protein
MNIYKILPVVLLMLLTPLASAELVIIANPNSGIERLTKSEVINIYLGRYRRLSTGSTAAPIDIANGEENKAMFYEQLVNKNLAEINAYWARLVFSGKTRPPQQVDNAEDALNIVANDTNALAYVERSAVNSQVLIVFEWPPDE